MRRVKVLRAKHGRKGSTHRNWMVVDEIGRAFIYESHRFAMLDADRMARGERIGTIGMVGFNHYPLRRIENI